MSKHKYNNRKQSNKKINQSTSTHKLCETTNALEDFYSDGFYFAAFDSSYIPQNNDITTISFEEKRAILTINLQALVEIKKSSNTKILKKIENLDYKEAVELLQDSGFVKKDSDCIRIGTFNKQINQAKEPLMVFGGQYSEIWEIAV